jgi:predicted amidophosphoribosyltransferase
VTSIARALLDTALDAAFPARCLGCAAEGPPICARCEPQLDARLDDPPGTPMGLPGDIPAPLVQIDWASPFRGLARDALHAIKYAGERRLARPLGRAVARRWARVGQGATLITHVPVHAERSKRRGYDQAEDIAREAAGVLALPHATLLVRQRNTIAQFDLDRQDRATNVVGAFACTPLASSLVRGRWILLIDDVMTTGSTLSACGAALEAGGALAVSAVTVARER